MYGRHMASERPALQCDLEVYNYVQYCILSIFQLADHYADFSLLKSLEISDSSSTPAILQYQNLDFCLAFQSKFTFEMVNTSTHYAIYQSIGNFELFRLVMKYCNYAPSILLIISNLCDNYRCRTSAPLACHSIKPSSHNIGRFTIKREKREMI